MEAGFNDGVTRTVLIIDDEPEFRMAMEAFLSEYGYNIVLADGGQDAIQQLGELEPRLIFLDVNMPGMSGIEVLTEIRSMPQHANVPIIMLTGQGDTNIIMKAQELNATDFMTKPFEVKEILALIQKYIA